MNKINNGMMCLLASGKASVKASWDGSKIQIKVNPNSMGKELKNCSDMIDSTCLIKTGVSTQGEVEIDDSANFDQ